MSPRTGLIALAATLFFGQIGLGQEAAPIPVPPPPPAAEAPPAAESVTPPASAPDVAETEPEERAGPRPLDHEAADAWNLITNETISRDGAWVLYRLVPGDGDATLIVRDVAGQVVRSIVRGASPRFTADSQFAIALVEPDEDEVKKAKKAARKKGKKEGKDADEAGEKKKLVIIDLDAGAGDDGRTEVERVKSFQVPEEAGGWVAWLHERPPKEPKTDDAAEDPAEQGSAEEKPTEPEEPAAAEASKEEEEEAAGDDDKEDDEKKDDDVGTQLILRSLANGATWSFPDVTAYAFSEDGTRLLFTTSAKDAENDGAWVLATGTGTPHALATGPGRYVTPVFAESGTRAAFLAGHDDDDPWPEELGEAHWSLHHWSSATGTTTAVEFATGANEGDVPVDWAVSGNRAPHFSHDGSKLFFGTAPFDPAEEDDEDDEDEDEDEKAVVDIWNWKDARLQPHQLAERAQDEKRSYLAVCHLGDGAVVQLGTPDVPDVEPGSRGDADIALGIADAPYLAERSWNYPWANDAYAVDMRTGVKRLLAEAVRSAPRLSPNARYVTWWDGGQQAWFARTTSGSGKPVNLTALLPHPVQDELHDQPADPDPYGSAGWTEDDKAFLVYDRFDVWATNPAGFWPAVCVTDGVGRERGLRFRYVEVDPEATHIESDETMLLSAFDDRTKANGFFTDRFAGTDPPREHVMLEEALGRPVKALDADALMLTRQTFERFPDLWVSPSDAFTDLQRVSDANPQQSEYLWGSSRLVSWTSLDGQPLEGMLFTPDGFDASQQYPMMVYFYERYSDRLHRYWSPEPPRSVISFSFYVSRGYVVFVPDIPYTIGFPGQSAVNAVLPGVSNLIERGFVDPARIGVQGHSWGGYQIAHLVTRTNIFAAAEAGAPVSNMTSAYGGIRWGTGLSRMFQYEKTQSRIGGTLWDAQQRYIENSPIFWADRVETPLLMMHNDEDGAVPWYQGIEMFVALRRLQKPVWLVNYNGEPHNLTKRPNRKDWAIRMQQFFDHYLKDAPAPVWLEHGVPAVEKGKSLGLELVGE